MQPRVTLGDFIFILFLLFLFSFVLFSFVCFLYVCVYVWKQRGHSSGFQGYKKLKQNKIKRNIKYIQKFDFILVVRARLYSVVSVFLCLQRFSLKVKI